MKQLWKRAKLGLRTALIEKDSLGGTCLNRGCIPTKTLLHSAKLYEEVRDAAQFGISIDHVQADLSGIHEHKQTTITTLQKGIAALLKAAKVTIYQGLGTVIDTGVSHAEAIKEVQITSDDADPASPSRPDRSCWHPAVFPLSHRFPDMIFQAL